MRYHVTSIKMAIIKQATTTTKLASTGKMGKLETLWVAGGNVKWCKHYIKVWQFLKKLKIELPYASIIPILGIYPKAIK